MENPPCMQIGKACRFADTDGNVHDATITSLVSSLDGIVNLAYHDGAMEASNVPHSTHPKVGHWGCAEEGAPQSWGTTARVTST